MAGCFVCVVAMFSNQLPQPVCVCAALWNDTPTWHRFSQMHNNFWQQRTWQRDSKGDSLMPPLACVHGAYAQCAPFEWLFCVLFVCSALALALACRPLPVSVCVCVLITVISSYLQFIVCTFGVATLIDVPPAVAIVIDCSDLAAVSRHSPAAAVACQRYPISRSEVWLSSAAAYAIQKNILSHSLLLSLSLSLSLLPEIAFNLLQQCELKTFATKSQLFEYKHRFSVIFYIPLSSLSSLSSLSFSRFNLNVLRR